MDVSRYYHKSYHTIASCKRPIFIGIGILFIVAGIGWHYIISPPAAFPEDALVTIPDGSTGSEIGDILERENIIRSKETFLILSKIIGGARDFQAGLYLFEDKQSLFEVQHRVIRGEYGLTPISITLIEGMTAREMSERVGALFPYITAESFYTAAEEHEGYLFPDTYTFFPTADEKRIITTMRMRFDAQIATIEEELALSPYSLEEIVTMASLVEKEARTTRSRRMVAGILWERIEIGMPLQVDAVFGYIYDRPTFSPSFDDLEVDSPYNTYRYAGLPPGPIANPSLDAIQATVRPIESEYLYYLTGTDGEMYYAETFNQHRENRVRYLD